MRKRTARSFAPLALGGAPLLALLFSADAARAQQVDTNPPLPNVMLLIDNSGSMERMINGNAPEQDPNPSTPSGTNTCNCHGNGPDNAPTCDWTGTAPSPNRWNVLQQALTGTLANGFSCVAMPRTGGTVFEHEYEINGKHPYDFDYYMPYHRLIAKDPNAAGATSTNPGACVIAPGGLNGANVGQGVGETGAAISGNATDFTGSCSSGQCTGSIVTREYALIRNPVACTFAQNNDGALTQMRDLMRFGVMMFDSDPGAGIGVTTGGSPQVLGSSPFEGMWTYYPGWSSGAACTEVGNPAGCANPAATMAVGARNPAAPPWEGRLVGFPAANDITSQETNNGIISEVVLASRPYGGTPTAGMFAGAQYFFLNDLNGPQHTDTFVQGGCRHEFIILLSDGVPNLDMQPACSQMAPPNAPAGVCPFQLPQRTAAALWNNGHNAPGAPAIETFVIGFAVSSFQDQGVLANCSQLAQNGNLSSQCDCSQPFKLNDPNQALQACCSLQCIAAAGGSSNAYFADTPGALQNALGSILGIIAQNATTRTTPAYSPVIANVLAGQGNSNSNVFLASFNPSPGKPWSGDVQRQRYVCTTQGNTFTIPTPTITATAGDDFKQNLNSSSGPPRTFIAFQPAVIPSTSTVDSTATIRPYVASSVPDGLGQYSATTYAGAASAVIPNITPDALKVPTNGCPYLSTQNGSPQKLTRQLCATMLLDFDFAQSSFGSGPPDFSFVSRSGNAFGDVFHSNPVVVGPPGSLLQDPLYVAFRQKWPAAQSTRAVPVNCGNQNQSTCRNTVLYVATNDGLLHAFWADETTLENNEMWAMLLPQAAASLVTSYPSNHEFLLDGSLVAKDVVWERTTSTTDPNAWHTMLVASYGSSFPGYYAVDVTNPDPTGMTSGGVPTDPPSVGPVFRWQLTTMPATNFQLFGQSSATPAISTLFMDPDGNGAREIGVAILPGGQNGPPTSTLASGGCARATKTSDSAPVNSYQARGTVRCWGANGKNDGVVGRSLTIVRLDTGEIIRTFGRKGDFPAGDTLARAHRVIATDLDSPMTGTPVVYPTDVGTDTTKVFVGDADGTIWKFDLSSSNPSNWTGELYLDLYNQTADNNGATAWNDGQPLQVTPVVALDPAGEVVLEAATGTTQTFDTSGAYFVYSVTEKVQGSPAKLRAYVNWWLGPKTMSTGADGFDPGERVSGPMTVFNGTVYFATYAAAPQSALSCSSDHARLWGRDFVRPAQTDPSQGGVHILQPPPPNPPLSTPPSNIEPATYPGSSVPPGAVIPGVSIMNTPACASLGNPTQDPYVFGAQHAAPQNFTPGSISLFSQVGTPNGTGGTATGTMQIGMQTPIAPTSVDSWAAVLE